MKEIVRQIDFEWPEQQSLDAQSEVTLDPATADAIIVLMARALIAVVSVVVEVADER